MATDLAELLGGAIGLSLLFGIPLLAGMVVTAFVVYGILLFSEDGFRPIELIIGGLVAMIGLCYLIELFIAPVDWAAAAWHSVVPHIAGPEALALAVGIVGATVMPHAVYLHSGLTQARIPARNDERKTQDRPRLQPRGRRGAGDCRPCQHGDGVDGLGGVPRGPQRRRRDRDRLSHAGAAARPGRRRRVPGLVARLRASRARRSARWPGR